MNFIFALSFGSLAIRHISSKRLFDRLLGFVFLALSLMFVFAEINK